MYLSRTLERVRDAFRRRTPGRHSRTATRPVAPPVPSERPSPDVSGARLVTARRTRGGRHAAPPQAQPRAPRDWEAEEAWEPMGALVRPYVAALGASPRNERAGAQGAPGEAAPWR
jgi:hypothetical protein